MSQLCVQIREQCRKAPHIKRRSELVRLTWNNTQDYANTIYSLAKGGALVAMSTMPERTPVAMMLGSGGNPALRKRLAHTLDDYI